MTPEQHEVPDPPKAPDSVQVMDTGDQPFLTRASRRQAREALGPDVELPPIAHVPRYLSLGATVAAAILVAVSSAAGAAILALTLLVGSLIVAWGWPRAAGLPSPRGSSAVLGIASLLLIGLVSAAETDPYLRWGSVALALGLVTVFLHQLMRRDGRPRLTESVMGTSLGLVVLGSGAAYLPMVHDGVGPQLITCAMVGIAAGSAADLFVGMASVRAWLLPLSMVAGGFVSVIAALIMSAPAVPAAALIGVCAGALSHVTRRLLAPEAGSYSSQGQIATGLASVAMVGSLLWAINMLVVR